MPTNRRRFLATAASLVVTGIAGCSGDTGDNKVGGQPTRTTKKKNREQTLSFGETFELPRVSITLSNPQTMKNYEWSENGQDQVSKAGEGKQWYMVDARVENTADRTVRLPLTLNFKAVRGDTVYHPGRNKSKSKKYVGGKAPTGAVHEGQIGYLTPEGVDKSELHVLYEEWRPSDKQRVVWQP